MRYVIHITTLQDPIRFFAKGLTREEAHAEGLAFVHAWPLEARNQPCGLRIEESRWLYAGMQQPPDRKGDDA